MNKHTGGNEAEVAREGGECGWRVAQIAREGARELSTSVQKCNPRQFLVKSRGSCSATQGRSQASRPKATNRDKISADCETIKTVTQATV